MKLSDANVHVRVMYRSPEHTGWVEAIVSMGGDDLGVSVKKVGLEMIGEAMKTLERETGQRFLPTYSIFPSKSLLFEWAKQLVGDTEDLGKHYREFIVTLKDRIIKLFRLMLEWTVPPGVLKEQIGHALSDKQPVGLIRWQDMEAQDLAYTLLFEGFNPHTLQKKGSSGNAYSPEMVSHLIAPYQADSPVDESA